MPAFMSCASNLTNKTDYRLCYDLATLPSYNINTSARKDEISKRGINCNKFADRIDKEEAQERLARARAPKTYNTYKSGMSSRDKDRLNNLENAQRNRDFQCIMDGGVPSFGKCL
mgnify:CR=1 FL=1